MNQDGVPPPPPSLVNADVGRRTLQIPTNEDYIDEGFFTLVDDPTDVGGEI